MTPTRPRRTGPAAACVVALLAARAVADVPPPGSYDLCRTYYRIADYRAAINECKEAYVETQNPDVLYTLAQAYRFAGERDTAVTVFHQFLDAKGPSYPPVKRAEVQATIDQTLREAAAERSASASVPTSAQGPVTPQASGSPGQGAVTVTIDIGRLDADTYRRINGLALDQELVLRLVQEGFAVVAPPTRPDVYVALTGEAQSLVITARASSGQVARCSIGLDTAGASGERLEIAQKVASLVHEVETGGAPGGTVAPTAAPAMSIAPELEASPHTPPADLGATLGVLMRSGGDDPVVRGWFTAPLAGRLRLRATVGAVDASAPGITVVETDVGIGVGLRSRQVWRLTLDAALLGGAAWHHYSLDDSTLAGLSGDRLDPEISMPLGVTLHLEGRVDLTLIGDPGVARARTHSAEGITLWARGALRFEGGVGLRWFL